MKHAIAAIISLSLSAALVFGNESVRAFVAYLNLFSAVMLIPVGVLVIAVLSGAGERGAAVLEKLCERFWLRCAMHVVTASALVYAGYPKIAAFCLLITAVYVGILYSASSAARSSTEDKNEVHP